MVTGFSPTAHVFFELCARTVSCPVRLFTQASWVWNPEVAKVPAGPCGPWGPCGPVSPAGPCGPCGPVSPAGPCGPCGPCGPDGPTSSSPSASPLGTPLSFVQWTGLVRLLTVPARVSFGLKCFQKCLNERLTCAPLGANTKRLKAANAPSSSKILPALDI